jgi:predicted nucleotidyltransferase
MPDIVIARVLAATDGVISAYLFGNFAAGREHRESDVDVGVLLDRDVHAPPVRVSTCASSWGPGSATRSCVRRTS